jgi:hypothetical protein
LPDGVASELNPIRQKAFPIELQHGIPAARLTVRLRFKDEYPVGGYHDMVDIQAVTHEVVEHTGAIRPQVLQELPHTPLAQRVTPRPREPSVFALWLRSRTGARSARTPTARDK